MITLLLLSLLASEPIKVTTTRSSTPVVLDSKIVKKGVRIYRVELPRDGEYSLTFQCGTEEKALTVVAGPGIKEIEITGGDVNACFISVWILKYSLDLP